MAGTKLSVKEAFAKAFNLLNSKVITDITLGSGTNPLTKTNGVVNIPMATADTPGIMTASSDAQSYEIVTLANTEDIASVESAWAIKRGDGLVWLYIQATTAATVSSATATLFSGLPKSKRYSRIIAQMGNTNDACRVGITTDGRLQNAYTQVSAISGQPLCVNCMYFAE